jgi:hypothetical protein
MGVSLQKNSNWESLADPKQKCRKAWKARKQTSHKRFAKLFRRYKLPRSNDGINDREVFSNQRNAQPTLKKIKPKEN